MHNIYCSEVKKGYRTKHVLFDENDSSFYLKFLSTGNLNPVAIFGNDSYFAAINMDGGIINIPSFVLFRQPNTLLQSTHLPDGQKAVSLAFIKDYLFALSSDGELYSSKDQFNLLPSFHLVKKFTIKDPISQISGFHNHLLVLTKSVKVFAFGGNECGQAGIGNNQSFISKFTEISSLKPYIIKNVY